MSLFFKQHFEPSGTSVQGFLLPVLFCLGFLFYHQALNLSEIYFLKQTLRLEIGCFLVLTYLTAYLNYVFDKARL